MEHVQRHRRPGRPPRKRPVHRSVVYLTPALDEVLLEWSERLDVMPGTYVNQLLATAFQWQSRYLWPLEPDELHATREQLQSFARSMRPTDLLEGGREKVGITIDVELGEQIQAFCTERGFRWSEFVRTLLAFAFGIRASDLRRRQQLEFGLSTRQGGVRARAS